MNFNNKGLPDKLKDALYYEKIFLISCYFKKTFFVNIPFSVCIFTK